MALPIEMNSLSSSLMLGTTLYRNQTGITNKFGAQFGYFLIGVIAAVESVAALVFTALSLLVYPFSSAPFARSTIWLGSCAFSLGWSVTDFIFNLFADKLVADEKSARKILESGNMKLIPHGALI